MTHGGGDGRTIVERSGERELVVRRSFDAPIGLVFDAWTRPELFQRWWAPRSTGVPILSCAMDVRTGGTYRLAFGREGGNSMVFFGRYLEVTAPSHLVWTNDESENGAVTTVSFEERDGKTLLELRETYPSPDALDEACAGMEGSMPEQFDQLDALLLALDAGG